MAFLLDGLDTWLMSCDQGWLRRRVETGDNEIFVSNDKAHAELPFVAVTLLVTVLFFVFRFMFSHLVAKPLGSMFSVRPRTMPKFAECTWYSLYYVSAFCWGVSILYTEEWANIPFTTDLMWQQWPLHHFSADFRLYYSVCLAFYLHLLVSLLFIDERRSDFYEYVVHHAATIILVASSYWYRYLRVGIVILVLHDFGDIFLYCTKSFRYMSFTMATNIGFALFALAFLVSRLIFFPIWIIGSVYYELPVTVTNPPVWLICTASLIILQVLHVGWFYLIVRMIVRALMEKDVGSDIRSDSDAEPSSKPAKPKKPKIKAQ